MGFSLVFFYAFKSVASALVCFCAGILVDVDHYFDYVRDRGLDFNIKRFFCYINKEQYDQLYLVFHAYEYLVLLALMLVLSNYNLLLVAGTVGFTQHLLFDQLTNPVKPFAYFMTYRFKKGFSKQCLLQDEYLASLKDT